MIIFNKDQGRKQQSPGQNFNIYIGRCEYKYTRSITKDVRELPALVPWYPSSINVHKLEADV